jgi:hypothetical protein
MHPELPMRFTGGSCPSMPEPHESDFLKRLEGGSVSPEEIREILADESARKYHAVRRALAAHPRTPRAEALALVATLFWRDLAWVSAEARTHPQVRRAAEQELLKRLPGMALAEKADLAGCAGRGVIAALRLEAEPRLVRGLLRNRYTVESDVVILAARASSVDTLEMIVSDALWGVRSAVRTAVTRNRATPLAMSVGLVPSLPLEDLRDLAREFWRPDVLRECVADEMRRRLEGPARVH